MPKKKKPNDDPVVLAPRKLEKPVFEEGDVLQEATKPEHESIVRKERIPLWEAKWNKEALLEKRAAMGAREFDRGYRQRAISEEDLLFKQEWIDAALDRSIEIPDSVTNTGFWTSFPRDAGVDLAIAHEDREAAYFSLMGIMTTRDYHRWVLCNAFTRGLSFGQQVGLITEYQARYKFEIVTVESNAYQESMVRHFKESGNDGGRVPVRGFHTGKVQKRDLELGVPALAVEFEQNRWHIPYGNAKSRRIMEPLIEELRQFPSPGFHNDCVPRGTLIITSTGVLPIEEVKVGMEVLTHLGRFRKVLRVGNRIADTVYEVRAQGKPPIRLTSNHKIFLRKSKQDYKSRTNRRIYGSGEWVSIDDGLNLQKYGTCTPALREVVDLQSLDLFPFLPKGWVEEEGKLVGTVNPGGGKLSITHGHCNRISRFLSVDKDFLMMLGYYMAEGSCGAHSIGFASHLREAPIREWLSRYLESLGLRPTTRKVSTNGCSLTFGSKLFRSFFKSLGTRQNKKLPDWVMFLPPEKQKYVLIGYLLGDGCFTKGVIKASTISPNIAFIMHQIAMRMGVAARLVRKKGQNGHKEQWALEFSSYYAKQIKQLIPEPLLLCKLTHGDTSKGEYNATHLKFVEGGLVGNIKSTTPLPHNDVVFNLEVEDDNSYVANGTAVHNCIMSLFFARSPRVAGVMAKPKVFMLKW